MKNVFKKALCLLTASLMFILCACNNSAENNGLKENEATLETILSADKINFDANYVEVSIYSDKISFFTNKNKDFFKALTSFLKDTNLSNEKTDLEKQDVDNFYIGVYDGKTNVGFYIYENDVVKELHKGAFTYYYCEGIYKKFQETFSTVGKI